jgi:hypothetical protein
MLAAYSIRRFTPATGWLHTAAGAALIAFVCGLLGAVAQAIQSHGLSTAVIVPAIAAFVMSFIATANPSMRSTEGKDQLQVPLAAMLPLLFLSALVGGCVTAKKIAYDAAACALGQVPSAVATTVDEAEASLTGAPGAPSWDSFAETTLLAKGIDAAICIVEAALHDIDGKLQATALAANDQAEAPLVADDSSDPNQKLRRAHKRGVDWLEARGVTHHHIKRPAQQ